MFHLRRHFLLILALLSLLIFLFNLPPFSGSLFTQSLRRAGFFVSYPFQSSFSAALDFTGRTFSGLVALRQAQKENQALKQKIQRLYIERQGLDGLSEENLALRKALKFSKKRFYGFNLVPAEVISRPPALFFQSVVINKGASHGIAKNMVVMTAKGLVGKIVEVFDFSSRALLLIDAEQAVSVVNRNSGDFGVLSGTGSQRLALKYVLNQASVSRGDLIVTSGLSEIYPAYLPVGKVRKAVKRDFDLFQDVTVVPLVDFSRLKEVFILKR